MLEIEIPEIDMFDDIKQEFISVSSQKIQLEHSLVSMSSWESKWHKPFISKDKKTLEETLDYIKFMTITPNVDPVIYDSIANNDAILEKINNYIDDSQTASVITEKKKSKKTSEFITAETIYYWMISLQIPVEFQYWHLNKLIALIRFCSAKNEPPKKMSKREIMERNTALNAARRKALKTKG